MTKYHINKKGIPAPCRATKGNCPLGGEGEHFSNKEEAEKRAKQLLEKEYGLIKNVDGALEKDFQNVYSRYEEGPFMVHVEYLKYLGYLNYTDNPEAVQKEFNETFGEKSFVVESKGENEVVDMADYTFESDSINLRYREIGEELSEEGYNTTNFFDEESPEYFGRNKDFREEYKKFQAERQGEEKEFHGKKLRVVESPHSEATKEFFRSYIEKRL